MRVRAPDGKVCAIIGRNFVFPFQTIEDILFFGPKHIGVLNDNNFPFSAANSRSASAGNIYASQCVCRSYFEAEETTSFWKRGFFRSGSNIGSSRSNAGVRGGFAARGASYGIESSFSKVEIERSGGPALAVTRASISIDLGPVRAAFSTRI